MGVPSEIYYGQDRIIETLSLLNKLPVRSMNAIIDAKDIQYDLRECENCEYGPDSRLKDSVEQLVLDLDRISQLISSSQIEIRLMTDKFGWTIDYDEDHEINLINGPCWDDEKEEE